MTCAGVSDARLNGGHVFLPPQVGITLYKDATKLFIDLNNNDIDTKTDTITPTADIVFDVEIPATLRNKEQKFTILSPDKAPAVEMERLENNRIRFKVGSFDVYTCLVVGFE